VKRLGLLGGTFDPPHYGHLVAAQEVAWQLQLDRVLFLPARQNPLKEDLSSSAEDRFAMVQLAVDGNALFEASRVDLDRPPPSYTADLLRALDAPNQQLYFIVGADILPELPRWRSPDDILRLARLAVVNRPGAPAPDVSHLHAELRERADVVDIPGMAIAARDLRQRVREGRPITYLTPPPVEKFIRERGLYRGQTV
jgi:nicotinate-nucleotide adenylyltransferase